MLDLGCHALLIVTGCYAYTARCRLLCWLNSLCLAARPGYIACYIQASCLSTLPCLALPRLARLATLLATGRIGSDFGGFVWIPRFWSVLARSSQNIQELLRMPDFVKPILQQSELPRFRQR